jgi:hypothetical protein
MLNQVSLTNFPKFCNNCFLSLYYLFEASKKLSSRLLNNNININFLDVPVTINQVGNWTNSIGVKESAIILRNQEKMTGNCLLNNLIQANVTSQMEGILLIANFCYFRGIKFHITPLS